MQEKANSLNSNRTSTKIHDIGDIELKKKKFRRNRSVLIKVDLLEEIRYKLITIEPHT